MLGKKTAGRKVLLAREGEQTGLQQFSDSAKGIVYPTMAEEEITMRAPSIVERVKRTHSTTVSKTREGRGGFLATLPS